MSVDRKCGQLKSQANRKLKASQSHCVDYSLFLFNQLEWRYKKFAANIDISNFIGFLFSM